VKKGKFLSISLTAFALLFLASISFAQESEKSQEEWEAEEAALAKATQNPLAAMYSLPFQNNTTYGMGEFNRAQNILNIQPVIPVSLGSKVNLINRIIIPVITQPSSTEDKSTTGVGDIVYTAWFSPTKASKITWGIGSVMQIPTASEANEFGSREFGIGPSLVALTTLDKWVAGFVIQNIWTFGDVSESKFLFQYFVNYNLPNAWYLVSAPILTANWNAAEGQKWIVPFGGGAGKVFRIGKLPINANAQVYYNAVKPDGVGDWGTRFQLQFLFPKK
jgi:hypothetical protein